jgi:hypothetical protein
MLCYGLLSKPKSKVDKAVPFADGRLELSLGPLEHAVVWLKTK